MIYRHRDDVRGAAPVSQISVRTSARRPLTVGLQIFASTDQGIDWSIITAATLMTSAPLLLAFLLFQRQFGQSFMRAGIR
jgi:sn-glycerol 3-phosphate transport system permease protein